MEQKVIGIIRKAAEIATDREILVGDDLFIDLGIDSITGLKILARLEDEFEVEIPDEKLAELNTVGKLIETLKEC